VTREELRIDQFEFHNDGLPFLHIGDWSFGWHTSQNAV
jgi:hypothetical protein